MPDHNTYSRTKQGARTAHQYTSHSFIWLRHSCFYRGYDDAEDTRQEMECARFRKAKDAAVVWIGLRCTFESTDDDLNARW